MRVRIFVADQAQARLYDAAGRNAPLHQVACLVDPAARLHDRDFNSDRPGRVFNHASTPGARRGATPRHAVGGADREPRKHEAELFARRIAKELMREHDGRNFERVVVMAAPAFLGKLRRAFPASLRSVVTAEIAVDLVHQGEEAVKSHLPPETFDRPV
jgi:protein required for attachment to host cells